MHRGRGYIVAVKVTHSVGVAIFGDHNQWRATQREASGGREIDSVNFGVARDLEITQNTEGGSAAFAYRNVFHGESNRHFTESESQGRFLSGGQLRDIAGDGHARSHRVHQHRRVVADDSGEIGAIDGTGECCLYGITFT